MVWYKKLFMLTGAVALDAWLKDRVAWGAFKGDIKTDYLMMVHYALTGQWRIYRHG